MHLHTPLISAPSLARELGVANVYLKLDVLQRSGSFKLRGIGQLVTKAKAQAEANASSGTSTGTDNPENRTAHRLTTVVSSSGGNAGLAVALAAAHHGLAAHVVVPLPTGEATVQQLRALGATVTREGSVWDEAHAAALRLVASLPEHSAVYVHPFDHPEIWAGHASIVAEIKQDLDSASPPVVPDAIICSVGGGGLLAGILQGLAENYAGRKIVAIAVETDGAASFAAAVKHGYPVEIPAITTFAKSLGAKIVAQGVLDKRAAWGNDLVRPLIVSDKQALDAIVRFANEFRMLAEPACGAALVPVLLGNNSMLKQVMPELGPDSTIIVEVCGGSAVSLDLIQTWLQTIK